MAWALSVQSHTGSRQTVTDWTERSAVRQNTYISPAPQATSSTFIIVCAHKMNKESLSVKVLMSLGGDDHSICQWSVIKPRAGPS